MKSSTVLLILTIGFLLATAQSCLECGEECKRVCGTKQFKACCFNYLRKRTFPPSGPDLKTLDANSQLEVSLANSAMRRGRDSESAPPGPQYETGQYLPVAAVLARQSRYNQLNSLNPLEQGRLQLIYDA